MSSDTSKSDSPTETINNQVAPKNEPFSVRLVVVSGPNQGAELVVASRRVMIGRAQSADLQIKDPTVSSFHLEVSASIRGVEVRDLGSTNGTIFHGAKIREAIVPAGSQLQVGDSIVRISPEKMLSPELHEATSLGELRGRSSIMREAFGLLSRLAKTELSVLITGPTGTGKELAARALHLYSTRSNGPFRVLDCTSIPSNLAESLLFGHEKGAFTGATERKLGVFESATNGTVFLDEVGELPLELQAKLLRVLERREIVRVGATEPTAVSVRVVAAT